MNPAKILRDLLGNNATRSRRINDMQGRGSSGGGQGSHADMGRAIEDILGVGEERRRRQPQQRRPAPRQAPQHAPQSRPPASASRGGAGGGLGDLLGEIFGQHNRAQKPAPPKPDSATQEHATFLIRAMCNAAKVDGDIDQSEQDAIVGRLGDVTREEVDFVRRELAAPLNLADFCRSIPDDLTSDIYGFSLMAIQLDNLREAAYLGRLAAGLDLDTRTCNQLHEKLGAPQIFA